MRKTPFIISLISIVLAFEVNARLLDKILSVIDDKIITLSQVKRVQQNLIARRNISPLIYFSKKFSQKKIIAILTQRILVRDRLNEMGYIISDDQVESQIKATEKRLGLNRSAMLNFLKSNNITFDEYFELVRETIEFRIFNERVIRPLISITEQEVKNTFYKENLKKNRRLAFKYSLVDFSLPKEFFKKGMLQKFRSVLKNFQINGVLPSSFEKLDTNTLGDITEDGLTRQLKNLLKKTDEGSFTKPILLGDAFHVFFIKSKNLVESKIYQRAKKRLRIRLYNNAAKKITSLWYKREESKHYIKHFFYTH